MASGISPMAPGDPPPPSERRIVLLGKAGAGKHRVVRVILGDTKLNEECEECFVYEGEQAGRRIRIVDTPGWDSTSIGKTTTKIKNEITRSVTLCPPGPHALVLVLPINTGDLLSVNDPESACQHMELLSERVWNYTMVLFLCDEDVKESRVKDHIQNAEKLLEKCKRRHYVMRNKNFETKVHGFLKEIDRMVKELGDFFLPQIYYDTMQSKIPQKEDPQKIWVKSQGEESVGKNMRRCGSLQVIYPDMTKQTEDTESHKDGSQDPKGKNQDLLPQSFDIKTVAVIVMAFMGALIGSVAGVPYGTVGAVVTEFVVLWFVMLLSL